VDINGVLKMAEEINRILDKLVDDFRYTILCFMSYIDNPAYYFEEGEIEQIKSIWKKWFDEK